MFFYKHFLILKIIPQNERALFKKIKKAKYSRPIKQNTAPGTETGAKEIKAIRQYQHRVLIWQRLHSNIVLSIRPLFIDPHVLANTARTEQNSAVTKGQRRRVGNSINMLFL